MAQRLTPFPTGANITVAKDAMSSVWTSFFQSLYDLVRPLGANGTTAARPTTNLYVGQQYFDTTLGFAVWVKSLGPTVWVRYDGTAV